MAENTEMMEINNEEVKAEETTGHDTENTSGKSLGVVAAGFAVAAVVGVVVAARKGKGKLNEWRAKKLEKAGYTVEKPEEDIVDGDFSEEKESEE